MNKLWLALFLCLGIAPAQAQNFNMPPPAGVGVGGFAVVASCGAQTLSLTTPAFGTVDATGKLCTAASVTASVSGFVPSASGARGTPITVTTSDSSGTLPTGATVIVSNTGTNPMYCNVNGVAATTSDQFISQSGGWFSFTIPAAITTLHCIATGNSTTANMVGGTGLAAGVPGLGGSTITTWAGGTLGAMANYGTSPGAVLVPGVNAFITNTIPTQAPTVDIGAVGISQTTPGTTNKVALGALPRAARNTPGCTVGTSSGTCLAATTAVTFLQIQNTSTTNTVACNIVGGTAVLNSATSIQLAVGQSASWGPNTGGVPSGAINCIASGASTPLYVEWL
jgi:hypothetical protein